MKNQSTENFKARRIQLKLLLRAHKAYRRAEQLQEEIKYWYTFHIPYNGFKPTESNINMAIYVLNLEEESKKEMEFFTHVFRNYCTDQGTDGQVGEVSPINSPWH